MECKFQTWNCEDDVLIEFLEILKKAIISFKQKSHPELKSNLGLIQVYDLMIKMAVDLESKAL
jgi:hypothetical protein